MKRFCILIMVVLLSFSSCGVVEPNNNGSDSTDENLSRCYIGGKIGICDLAYYLYNYDYDEVFLAHCSSFGK